MWFFGLLPFIANVDNFPLAKQLPPWETVFSLGCRSDSGLSHGSVKDNTSLMKIKVYPIIFLDCLSRPYTQLFWLFPLKVRLLSTSEGAEGYQHIAGMASSIRLYLKEKEKHLLIKFDHILAVIEFNTEYFVKVCKTVSSVYPQHKQDSEKNQRIKSVQYLPT